MNDLAMMGARPQYLTVGFILEEGLEMGLLAQVVESMRLAAAEAGVQIIAGDTKVVQKGKADGLYINTAGVGLIADGIHISGTNAQPGDVVILSGPMGDHGIAVLGARGELGFEADVVSDAAPLNHLVQVMLAASANIHVLRDPTRGGVATTLNEIAKQSNVGIVLDETLRSRCARRCRRPVRCWGLIRCTLPMRGDCWRWRCACGHADAAQVLTAMRQTRYGEEAVVVGEVPRIC